MSYFIGELYEIRTADGLVYQLSDGEGRFVVSTIDNAGLPSTEFFTRRAYKSDKLIETGFRLTPRSFSIAYQFTQDCGRDEYWAARSELLEATRPNRGGALTVVLMLSTGQKRAIKARAITPVFPSVPVDQIDEWRFAEVLQFEAYDPVFFYPDYTAYLLFGETLGELTFPITFDDSNIFFGQGSLFGQLAITYSGSWYALPIITVSPPYDSVRVSHNDLNASIQVLKSSSISSLIIDLENNTIMDSDGNDLSGFLTPDSNLTSFRIEPNPIVSGGINNLTLTIPGSQIPTTTVLVSFKERYIGI